MSVQRHLTINSGSPQETKSLGKWLGQLLRAGDLICLCGDLGAGKTLYCRGIGSGWGADEPLTSPTFNLAQEHRRASDEARLFHIDCYRLRGPDDADSIGLHDILDSSAIALLEWPERVETVLPAARLWIDIFVDGGARREFVLRACGEPYVTLLARYQDLIHSHARKNARKNIGNADAAGN